LTLRHFTVRKWFPHRECSLPEVLKRAFCPAFSHPFHTAVSTKTTICTVSRARHQPKSGTEINNINPVEISNIYPPRSPSSTESIQDPNPPKSAWVQPILPDRLQPIWPDRSPATAKNEEFSHFGRTAHSSSAKFQETGFSHFGRTARPIPVQETGTALGQMQKMQRKDEFFDAPWKTNYNPNRVVSHQNEMLKGFFPQ